MAQERKKIDGRWVYLPDGVTLETVRGKPQLSVSCSADGKRKRKYFPATDDGLKAAKELADTHRKEKQDYGRSFGSITDDEKQAIDLWRTYRTACQKEACEYRAMSDIMREALERVQAVSISPTVKEAAQMYLADMSRRNAGETTPHMMTVKNRLRHISDALGDIHLCNLTAPQISDFIDTLKNPQTGTPAKATTKKQYQDLVKGLFKLAVKRGLLDDKKNAARMLDAPKIKRVEPETLTLEEVCRIFTYIAETPAEHRYIPALIVGFFAGARLAERCRLKYRDILLSKKRIYLSCEITKTNKDRHTYLQDNFLHWMQFVRAHGVDMTAGDYILPGATEAQRKDAHNRLLKRISKHTGIEFPKNCIRHTAATYMTELNGFTSTANQLGHGEGMLAAHYRVAVTKADALAYFSISPGWSTPAQIRAVQAKSDLLPEYSTAGGIA